MKGLVTGQSTKEVVQQDAFIDDFVKDAWASIANGIKYKNFAPPGAGGGPKPPGGKPPSTDPYEILKGQMRQLKTPGATPLDAKSATLVKSIQAAIAKLAKGDKESGIFAATKILELAKKGYDVGKLVPTWNSSSKAGERFLPESIYREISNILKEHGLTWENLGLRVHLYEGEGNVGVLLSRCVQKPITNETSNFEKLNTLFENIMEAAPASAPGAPSPAGETISDFLLTWFGTYMKGINWTPNKPMIDRDIADIEKLYNSGKDYKSAIKQLAGTAYTTYKKLGKETPPAGIGNLLRGNSPGSTPIDGLKKVWDLLSDADKQKFIQSVTS